MKPIHLLILLLLVTLALPASAFSADYLAMTVKENGDAEIRFEYTLNWIERIAVFFRIADPDAELKAALERAYKKPVEVRSVTPGSALFTVTRLAHMSETDAGTMYRIPALDFSYALIELERHWFAPLVKVDLSPDLTTVTFPDGHTRSFTGVTGIPALSYTIA